MHTNRTAQEQDVELAAIRFVCDLFGRNRHLSEGPVITPIADDALAAIAREGIPTHGRALD